MSDPAVTIVICTRNRGERLLTALDALSRIESRHPWDALMVDNASTDNTADIIRSYRGLGDRLYYALAERQGLGAARDFAWRQARGAILAFTDDDCYPAPDFVDALVEVFEEHPETALVGGRILLHDPGAVEMSIDTRTEAQDLAPYSFLKAATYQGANMAIRRNALAKVGGFDPELGAGTPFPCEDIDVAAALSWAGFKTRFDPRPVVYHDHGRNAEDIEALWRGYDAGRGAYYAKYLIRKDTRSAYLLGWGKRLFVRPSLWGVRQFVRELRAAAVFAMHRRRHGLIVVGIPLAAGSLAGVSALAFARAMQRRLIGPLRQ